MLSTVLLMLGVYVLALFVGVAFILLISKYVGGDDD